VARLLTELHSLSGGDIRFDGKSIGSMSVTERRAMRRRRQMIFQDPYASLNPRWRVQRIIAEPLATHTVMAAPEQRERVAELLV
jgi:peptide/nickel transport system ATP-binding protein